MCQCWRHADLWDARWCSSYMWWWWWADIYSLSLHARGGQNNVNTHIYRQNLSWIHTVFELSLLLVQFLQREVLLIIVVLSFRLFMLHMHLLNEALVIFILQNRPSMVTEDNLNICFFLNIAHKLNISFCELVFVLFCPVSVHDALCSNMATLLQTSPQLLIVQTCPQPKHTIAFFSTLHLHECIWQTS